MTKSDARQRRSTLGTDARDPNGAHVLQVSASTFFAYSCIVAYPLRFDWKTRAIRLLEEMVDHDTNLGSVGDWFAQLGVVRRPGEARPLSVARPDSPWFVDVTISKWWAAVEQVATVATQITQRRFERCSSGLDILRRSRDACNITDVDVRQHARTVVGFASSMPAKAMLHAPAKQRRRQNLRVRLFVLDADLRALGLQGGSYVLGKVRASRRAAAVAETAEQL